MKKLIIILLLSISFPAKAERLHLESWYQDKWCVGHKEYVLPDFARVDCLTDSGYAVEIDFADKWSEGLGQALFYARETGRKPGVVLIMERDSDWRYLRRLYEAILESRHDIKVWVVRP